MIRFLTICSLALCLSTPAQAEFSISFSWNNIPLCTSGNPNRVPDPEFRLTGVPEGTRRVVFEMVDLNVPNYDHGGGTVRLSGDGIVPEGAFRYRSPCPPNGSHTYEWRATARGGGQALGHASAQRRYPE